MGGAGLRGDSDGFANGMRERLLGFVLGSLSPKIGGPAKGGGFPLRGALDSGRR